MTMANGFFICGGDCVWPGDANSDGIANNLDLLSIGTGYGSTGTARPGATTNWLGQLATDWADTLISGVNYKHIDCNGDGTINNNDTLAIVLNYGSVHNKTSLSNQASTADPLLYLDISTDTVSTGTQLIIPLMLGTTSVPADSIYGLAFTINYDPSLIDTSSVSVSFNNSWLGTIGTDLISIQYDFYSGGKIEIAVTRTDQSNISGFGQIGELSITTANNLSGNSPIDTMLFTLTNVTSIANDESIINVNLGNDSLIIEDTMVIVLSTSIVNTSCASACDGSATVTASGCSGVYTYLWDDPATQTTAVGTGLCAGTYNVTVSDNSGCVAINSVTIIDQVSSLTNLTSSNNATQGICDGSGAVSASGGTAPYSYTWSSGQTSSTITGLCAGIYYVTITDNINCSITDSITILDTLGVGISLNELNRGVNVYPNPNTGQFNIEINSNKANGSLSIILYRIDGQKVFSKEIENPSKNFSHSIDLSKYSKGMYFLRVVTDNEVMTRKVIYH